MDPQLAVSVFDLESVSRVAAALLLAGGLSSPPKRPTAGLAAVFTARALAALLPDRPLYFHRHDSPDGALCQPLLGGPDPGAARGLHRIPAGVHVALPDAIRRGRPAGPDGGLAVHPDGLRLERLRHLPGPFPALEQLGHSGGSSRAFARHRPLGRASAGQSHVVRLPGAFRSLSVPRVPDALCADAPAAAPAPPGR